MSQRKTVTYPNPDVLAQAVAVRVLTTIRNLLAEPGRRRVDIALTGGTDGNRVLRAIGTDPLADDLDASRVHIWWGDERFVPEDSDDRNAKQARRFLNILVERGLMPEENIHEMPADTRDAAQIAAATDEENDAVLADAAATYQKELIEQLGEEPTLDIALFGVGPDAHFASLFPGRSEVLIDDPHVLVAGVLSIMAMRFDDRTGQSGRIANFVHSARGLIACPVRSGMRMGCSARSAQGCDADACTTPAKWHNACVVQEDMHRRR